MCQSSASLQLTSITRDPVRPLSGTILEHFGFEIIRIKSPPRSLLLAQSSFGSIGPSALCLRNTQVALMVIGLTYKL